MEVSFSGEVHPFAPNGLKRIVVAEVVKTFEEIGKLGDLLIS